MKLTSSPLPFKVTRTARIELLPDGMVLAVQSAEDQTVADATENVRTVAALLAGRRAPLVIDLGQMERSLPAEVRECYMRTLAGHVPALAFSGAGTLTRMLANSMLMVGRVAGHTLPMKMFERREDALAWARTFLPG